jgi:hypothetical protein
MFKRMLAGLVLSVGFAVVALGVPRADALPVESPTAKTTSCSVEKKCIEDCGCKPGCSVTCAANEKAKCEPAKQDKGLCFDAKCTCRTQPK